MCMKEKYRINHTIINGQRLSFVGRGGDLFVNWLKWILLTIITLGIYGFIEYKTETVEGKEYHI